MATEGNTRHRNGNIGIYSLPLMRESMAIFRNNAYPAFGRRHLGTTLAHVPDHDAVAVFRSAFDCGDDLAAVAMRIARFFDYPARGAIIEEGQECADVHLLTCGHARKQAVSIEGRMIVVEDYREGDLFGEAALSGDTTAHEDIRAVSASRTGAFANHQFVSLMSAHPAIALAVSRLLVSRLGNATRRFTEGFTLTAAGRVHAELLRRAEKQNAAAAQLEIRPPPVFSELALSVQSTRETVSRAVNALEKRGIVKRTDDALIIVAPHRLEELVY
ncbi:Crp/Fnr family transcriptional regulator [Novosphingobium sp. ZN18A2]|uniref:Crp/Fnr family transcriptional regulator n=1 Tax=Novosphingobium sp. ZN18A2 TaxID=3079861 RepID=UPI0030D310EE